MVFDEDVFPYSKISPTPAQSNLEDVVILPHTSVDQLTNVQKFPESSNVFSQLEQDHNVLQDMSPVQSESVDHALLFDDPNSHNTSSDESSSPAQCTPAPRRPVTRLQNNILKDLDPPLCVTGVFR